MRKSGKVKFYDRTKGFGFIHADGDDYYFNIKNVNGDAPADTGDIVEFRTTKSAKGLAAEDIIIIEVKALTDKNQFNDSRVICPSCQRKMVPRLIMHYGNVERSICPFCQNTYMDNRAPAVAVAPPSIFSVIAHWLFTTFVGILIFIAIIIVLILITQ